MNMKALVAFLLFSLSMPNHGWTQTEPAPEQRILPERFVYEWTDNNGVVHMTDDPSKVPKKYRSKSLKKKAEPRTEEVPENTEGGAGYPAPRSTPSDQELEQRHLMEEWQQRYHEWKDELRRSEQRQQSLQQKRADLLTKWGSPAVAPPAVREEVGQVDKDLQDTQAAIDEARHMLEVVLPEDARKAGVPPGWQKE